jgi:hypothetical protein
MNRKNRKKGPAAELAPEENARTGPAKTEDAGLQGAFGVPHQAAVHTKGYAPTRRNGEESS